MTGTDAALTTDRASIPVRAIGAARIAVAVGIVGILVSTYVRGIPLDGPNPLDYFGYFTNLTSLLTSVLLIALGIVALRADAPGRRLNELRAIATTCMLLVAVVYNLLVPGTGSAPAWVSAILHTVFPALVLLDWVFTGDRTALPWRRLWIVLPYPFVWLAVVLARGATDGWVPYGFLLPSRGPLSLALHVVGIALALIALASLVWLASRFRPSPRRRGERQSSTGQP